MNKLLPFLAFSILLLVPVGTQYGHADTTIVEIDSGATPSNVQIIQGDTIKWERFISPGLDAVLSSDENLFPPVSFSAAIGGTFEFTFNNPGTFNFVHTFTGGGFFIDSDAYSILVLDPLDLDNDGILLNDDNCPAISNPNQEDIDDDGQGDVCDENPTLFCGENAILVGFECQGVSPGGFSCGFGTQDNGSGECESIIQCGAGTFLDGNVCELLEQCEALGSMIGGALMDIDTTALLVASIGVNPVITALVGITIAGVVGQTVWFVHKRRK